MNRPTLHDAEGILRNGEAIDRAITETHRRVILRHRQMNVPLVIWRDGEAVEIPPESVELPVPKCWMTRGVRSREKTSSTWGDLGEGMPIRVLVIAVLLLQTESVVMKLGQVSPLLVCTPRGS